MNLAILPDILGLTLLILAYRPLLRRAGAHVDVWFAGWGLVICNLVVVGATGKADPARPFAQTLVITSIELCGLCFLLAAANHKRPQVSKRFAVALAVPMLVQAALASFAVSTEGVLRDAIFIGASLLFLAPAIYLLTVKRDRRRPMAVIAAGFAVLAIGSLPFTSAHPLLVADGVRSVIFLCAAYVCILYARQRTPGVMVAAAGLILWALKFPFVTFWLDHVVHTSLGNGLLEVPQYLVVAGSILTLLEDHVTRTERLAMHDPLTDLPNRRYFEDRFEKALDEAKREMTTLACLAIDVDNFKSINDTYGHHVGDELLRALAVRLSWHITPRDMLARTGGDEFSAMLAGVTDEHHLRFIAGAMMSAASVPVFVEGHSIDVRISVGIALSPDDADEMGEMRRMADEAMYRAKRRGGNLLIFAGDEEPAKEVPESQPGVAQVLQMLPQRKRAGGKRTD